MSGLNIWIPTLDNQSKIDPIRNWNIHFILGEISRD